MTDFLNVLITKEFVEQPRLHRVCYKKEEEEKNMMNCCLWSIAEFALYSVHCVVFM